MFSTSDISLFLTATFVLLIIPGPAVLYIVAQSLEKGPKYGVVSTAGIALGGFFHVIAAVIGLSAILATSAAVFHAVKYLGAAYLIYLGIAKLLEKPKANVTQKIEDKPLSKVFWQGVVVQVLNPKIALFFLSFLPQFVDAKRGNPTAQIAVLGITFVVLAFLSDATYALISGKVGHKIMAKLKTPSSNLSKWFVGFTYLGLGILAALTGNRKS